MKKEYDLSNVLVEEGCLADADRPFELRDIEKQEIRDTFGDDLTYGIRECIKESLKGDNKFYRGICKTTGDLMFIFGLCLDDDAKVGVPWFLTSSNFKPNKDFIRLSKEVVHEDMYAYESKALCNYIHVDNLKSIKWLKWLGFSFTAHPYKEDYNQFYRYKE